MMKPSTTSSSFHTECHNTLTRLRELITKAKVKEASNTDIIEDYHNHLVDAYTDYNKARDAFFRSMDEAKRLAFKLEFQNQEQEINN